jgi:hypothetical protein
MSFEDVKKIKYRGFTCEIVKAFPEEVDETPFYEFCITEFEEPTNLDKILFFMIAEGITSEGVASLIDLIGLTAFYPGNFNQDVDSIMRIGVIRHEEHIGCYATNISDEHRWKLMSPPEMEQMLKADIDRYHDVRKRLIQAMKFNKKMIDKMNEMATTSQTPPKP